MKTKIEKIGGRDKLVLYYKEQSFIMQCDHDDVKYFKRCLDIAINRFKVDTLDLYNKFLLKENYCDTDIICEEPTALDQFLILDNHAKTH